MWALFAFLATCGAAAMPLLAQHFKPDSVSMLFWLRLFSFLIMVPVVLSIGAPTDPLFYVGTAIVAIWMSVNDFIYFNAVKKHGAGVVARILPGTALITFFLWFFFDPALIEKYMTHPMHSAVILGLMGFGILCASAMKRDHVSVAAVRDIWFVLLTASIGPIIVKIVLSHADKSVAPLAFVMVQGIIVGSVYLMYQLIKKPTTMTVFTSKHSILTGGLIAFASMTSIGARGYAIQFVDNPAYVSMVALSAPVLISLYERAVGHPDSSNKWAGFGLLAASIALVAAQIR